MIEREESIKCDLGEWVAGDKREREGADGGGNESRLRKDNCSDKRKQLIYTQF